MPALLSRTFDGRNLGHHHWKSSSDFRVVVAQGPVHPSSPRMALLLRAGRTGKAGERDLAPAAGIDTPVVLMSTFMFLATAGGIPTVMTAAHSLGSLTYFHFSPSSSSFFFTVLESQT